MNTEHFQYKQIRATAALFSRQQVYSIACYEARQCIVGQVLENLVNAVEGKLRCVIWACNKTKII